VALFEYDAKGIIKPLGFEIHGAQECTETEKGTRDTKCRVPPRGLGHELLSVLEALLAKALSTRDPDSPTVRAAGFITAFGRINQRRATVPGSVFRIPDVVSA
jgi:hypothetical protein